jgi:hypothetical protein
MSKAAQKHRARHGGDFAEFRAVSEAPEGFEGKTVAIESGYSEAFVAELKDALPWDARAWDKEARVWRIAPRYQELAERITCRHYTAVWVCEGTSVRDLKSGVVQEGLF